MPSKKVAKVAKKVQARHGGSLSKSEAVTRARNIVRARKTGKNTAPQPIGPGKKGTLKRRLHTAGAGKKALKNTQGLEKSVKKALKKWKGFDVKAFAGRQTRMKKAS